MSENPRDRTKSSAQQILTFLDRFRDLPAIAWAISTGSVTLFATYYTIATPNWSQTFSLIALSVVVVASVLASGGYTLARPSLSERILRAKRDFDAGRIAFEDKRYAQAMDLFDRANREFEEYRYVSMYGRICLRLGNYDRAIIAFTKCHELALTKSERLAARRNHGVAFMIAKQWGSALEDFNEYLESKKKSAVIFRHRALVHFARNDLLKAEQDARTAIRIASTNSAPFATLAIVLKGMGNLPDAQRNLEKAMQNPETPAALYAIAQACTTLNRINDAYHYLTTTIQRDSRFSPRANNDPLLEPLKSDEARFKAATNVVEWKFIGSLEDED